MDIGLRTPLLDQFRRGDVPREIRMAAAEGAVAPRPIEQLGLLMLLSSDHDEEIRMTAERTLSQLKADEVAGILARPDAPTEIRAFFAARGIAPAAVAAAEADVPLVDTNTTDYGPETAPTPEHKAATVKRVVDMTIPEKVKAAMKGSREMRAILIRDPNRMVAMAVLSSPKITEQEVETFARMTNVAEDVLRTIGATRAWVKNYNVTLGLAKNPKTPLALSLALLNRLNEKDLRGLSTDRNVPEPLRIAARKKLVVGDR